MLEPGVRYCRTHALLQQFGVLYHPQLKVLICTSCETVVDPPHLVSHCKTAHQLTSTPQMTADALSLPDVFSILQGKDIILPAPGGPAVEFISTHLGYACGQCAWACVDVSALHKHLKTHPSDVNLPYRKGVHVQTLRKNHKVYFVVKPSLSEPDATLLFSRVITEILPSLSSLDSIPPIVDPRERSTLLRTIRYDVVTESLRGDRIKRKALLSLFDHTAKQSPLIRDVAVKILVTAGDEATNHPQDYTLRRLLLNPSYRTSA